MAASQEFLWWALKSRTIQNPGLYKIQVSCMEVGASLEKHGIHNIFFLTFSVGGNRFTEKGKAQLQQAVRDKGPDFVKLSLSLSLY